MWCMSSDCLQKVLNYDVAKKRSGCSQYYTKVKFILQNFREFFHADGNGLNLESLNTDKYKVQ